MTETEKKEELNPVDLETEKDYKALRTIFRGLGMSKIWDKSQEDHAIGRLYRLYLKATGKYKANEKKIKEEKKD